MISSELDVVMADSLKQIAIKGIGWSAIERFSVQGVTFIVQIVLARLLAPDDFGVIGMLTIFLQVAQVFIDSGFANALIKKQDCTDDDYSTVFYYNLGISVILYLLLLWGAPLISKFYSEELITPVLRVLSIVLIVNALSIVQKTILIKSVDFKSQSKVTLFSSVVSGFVGILLAYCGYGVWALVIQQILNSLLLLICYVWTVKWLPKRVFSRTSFRFVFSYGSKLLLSSIISTLYHNLYTIVIGKKFSSDQLGLYTRAESFAMFPSNNLSSIISRAVFPIMSKVQDDRMRLIVYYKKLIAYSSFIIFPLMAGLIAIAKPFIIVILTDKWIDAVPLLQILCVSWMFDHLCNLNLNLLYVIGRTDLVLRLEVIKKIIAVLILIISIPFGLHGMCWGLVLYSFVAVFINTYYTNKLFGYSWQNQFMDYFPYLLSSCLMAGVVFVVQFLFEVAIVKLVVGILTGIFVYSGIAFVCFKYIICEVKSFIKCR